MFDISNFAYFILIVFTTSIVTLSIQNKSIFNSIRYDNKNSEYIIVQEDFPTLVENQTSLLTDATNKLPIGNKVAICFTGDTRGIFTEDVRKSLLRTVRQFNADVFMSISLRETLSDEHFNITRWNDIHESIELLNPISVALETLPSKHPNLNCSEDEAPVLKNDYILYYQFEKVKTCYNLVRTHELIIGQRYKQIIRARPDMSFNGYIPINIHHCLQEICVGDNHFKGSVSDHFAIVPRHFADIYFLAVDHFKCTNRSILEQFNHNYNPLPIGMHVPPESFLSYITRSQGVKYRSFRYWVIWFIRYDLSKRLINL